ncbi:MAG: hypothetical protein IIC24_06980 [Chloroflexi bacterium]|nr:hypothetical protein [Chloroflexota bacterium]
MVMSSGFSSGTPVLLGLSGTLNYTPGDFGDVSWVDLSVEVKLPLFGG